MTQEPFRVAKMEFKFHWVDDGVKVFRYLQRDPPYEQAVRPDLILLDINLPRKDGRKVLHEIKNNEILKSIPVVVFTTSESHTELVKKYAMDSRCYIVKPSNFGQFSTIVQTVEEILALGSAPAAPETMHILLVEDDPGDEALLRDMLTERDHLDIRLDCVNRLQAGLDHPRQYH